MRTITLTGTVDLSANEGELKKFVLLAYSGGVMYPHLAMNWNGPVVADLAGMEIETPLPVHLDHDQSSPVGHVDSVDVSNNELTAAGVFSIDDENTRKLIASSKAGFPWKSSVGLKMKDYVTIQAGEKISANGREFEGPLLLVTKSILKEISFVTVPGDSESSATVLAKLGEAKMPTFEEWVASLGFDPATLSEEAKAVLTKQYGEQLEEPKAEAMDEESKEEVKAEGEVMPEEKKEEAVASGAVDLIASSRKQLAGEVQRASDIRKLCAKFGEPTLSVGKSEVTLAAHAIAEGWDLDKTELQIHRLRDLQAHRDARPTGPAIHSTSQSERGSLETLQAAAMLRAGINLDSPVFSNRKYNEQIPDSLKAHINNPQRQRVMDNAWEFRDMSMVDMVRAAMNLDPVWGGRVPRNRSDMIQASFSSSTVQNLFGSTIGAQVITAYNEIRDFTAGWTSESDNPDMESHNRMRLVAAQNLKYLPINGEAAHASRDLKTEATRVERFARQLEIDEADIMGDRFGLLAASGRDFGLAAARVRPDLGANVLLANPTLTATGRALTNTTDGNRIGSAALARATLSAAIAAMAKFKDGDASIGLAASHLVCPPDILDTAIQLTQSQNNATVTADQGEINPLARYGITAVGEPRLANGIVDPVAGTSRSGSTSTWWLVSKEAHTIEFTYLQAAGRAPMVRTTQLTNGRFGLNMDVRLYIGAKALDWRGFIYNQSAAL